MHFNKIFCHMLNLIFSILKEFSSLSIFLNLFYFLKKSVGKVFLSFENGQKKCPKFISPNIFPKKLICDHKLFLWCGR